MTADQQWQELHRSASLDEALRIATTLSSMEFDVQIKDKSTGRILDKRNEPKDGPFAIQVDAEAWADLRSVLDEIIDEQEEFDANMAVKLRRRRLWQRLMFAAIFTIVIVFSMRKWLF